MALDPNDTYALDNKAAALDNSGNYTGAKLYYDKALAIKSTIAGKLTAPVYPGQAQNVNSTNKEASNQTSVTAGNSTINLKLGNKAYPIRISLLAVSSLLYLQKRTKSPFFLTSRPRQTED